MSIRISAKLVDNKVEKKIQDIGTNDNLGMFMASEFYRLMIPFVPMDTGMLYQNVNIDPFTITFTQPYAHRIYTGDDLTFNREKHPNATDHWDRTTRTVKGEQFARTVMRYLNKNGK